MRIRSILLILLCTTAIVAADNETRDDELEGKVVWPSEYILNIARPTIEIGGEKKYLAGVVQNLMNDELFLQRMAITRGKVLPLKIEYSVQKDHANLPVGEREALLAKFKKPQILPLKIVRQSESPKGKPQCDKNLSTQEY